MAEVFQDVSDVSDVDVELLGRVWRQLGDGQNLFLEMLAGGASDAAQDEVGWSRAGTATGFRRHAGAKRKDSFLQKKRFNTETVKGSLSMSSFAVVSKGCTINI